jgi:hypothetical protein
MTVTRSNEMTFKRSALAATVLAGAALLAGCGGSPAAAPAVSATRTAAAAAAAATVTAPPALSAPDLAHRALAALQSGGSVHVEAAAVTQNGIADFAEDMTAKGGRLVQTAPDGSHIVNLLVDGTGFLKGNEQGLIRFVGLADSAAKRYAGKWIALEPGDLFGHINYDAVTAGLTPATFADSMRMLPPEKLTGAATVAGQRVRGVSGPVPTSEMPAGTTQVLYAADDASLRPVQITQQGGGVQATYTFSKWGEQVTVGAPTDALTAATLPSTT